MKSYGHTMDYCATFNRKEILSQATTWMDPEDIMLSELSQSQKDKYCMILLTKYLKHSKL